MAYSKAKQGNTRVLFLGKAEFLAAPVQLDAAAGGVDIDQRGAAAVVLVHCLSIVLRRWRSACIVRISQSSIVVAEVGRLLGLGDPQAATCAGVRPRLPGCTGAGGWRNRFGHASCQLIRRHETGASTCMRQVRQRWTRRAGSSAGCIVRRLPCCACCGAGSRCHAKWLTLPGRKTGLFSCRLVKVWCGGGRSMRTLIVSMHVRVHFGGLVFCLQRIQRSEVLQSHSKISRGSSR